LRREEVYTTTDYWDSRTDNDRDQAVTMWANNHLNAMYHEEQARIFSELLPDVKGKHLLDIGCGTGRISRLMAQRGAEVDGFDFAPKMVELARRFSSGENPRYRVLSVFDLDEAERYDIAVSWGAVVFACKNRRELLEALRNVRRALKQGGKLLLMEPVHRGFLHRVLNMDLREFLNTMEEAGFEVEHVRHLHFWPARLLAAYLPLTEAVTASIYRTGQWILERMGDRALGDYQAVLASVEAQG
jgi:SAM-dependent methyltransferase